MKYKLSKKVSISALEAEEGAVIPDEYLHEHYVLYNQNVEKEFLVNSAIKYFLDKFSTPKTEQQVFDEIKAEVESYNQELENICREFFQFSASKKIIVPEDAIEDEVVLDELFKEGDTLDDYDIIELLATRRYIEIYTALYRPDRSRRVIKLLNKQKTTNAAKYQYQLGNMEQEFSLLKSVDHIPTMCKAYELNKQHENFSYITLELIEGKGLYDFLDETEGLTDEDCVQLAENVLEAFSLLHENNVIHGDVHSSNVMVRTDKSVKIIDLGLAKKLDTDKNEVVHFGGVNYYMPPERINTTSAKKHVREPDLYSDVYQIGLLLYLILYKDLPFDGFIWEELATNIKEQEPPYPVETFLGKQPPNGLVEIIDRCLQKRPNDRYKQATEILNDFKSKVFAEKELIVN